MVPPPQPEVLPRRLGRYQLEELLGAGGMGRVFRATLLGPAGFRKAVALKLLATPRGETDSEATARRFLHEARLGAAFRHPNLLGIHDVGKYGAEYFIAMELVDGISLHRLLWGGEPLPTAALLEMGRQAARGLAHAAASPGRPGLVHRDIKPGNLMIDRHGVLKIVDFGLAAAYAATGSPEPAARRTSGTFGYMSPEQLTGEPLDARSDLFSLGVVLAELAMRRRLMRSRSIAQYQEKLLSITARVRSGALQREIDAVVPGLGGLVGGLLEFEVADRPRTATEVEAGLSALGSSEGERIHRAWAQGIVPPRPDPVVEAIASPAAAGSAFRTTNLRAGDAVVGRAGRLSSIASMLERHRLVTITGTGGVGKTTVAKAVGLKAADRLAGGAWFVDLVAARRRSDITAATASALGVQLSDGDPAGEEARIGRTLSYGGKTLLIVDNAEQVTVEVAAVVDHWLAVAPALRVLVTSRAPLGLSGEQVLDLPPLDRFAAVELFIKRMPGGHSDGPAREVVGDLVERLDRLPLAIELAAARTNLLPPHEILARLDQRFRLLRTRGGGRHEGLASCIEWSWDLLSPWEQAVLTQCSVFHGAWLSSVEAVVRLPEWDDAPWIVDALATLVAQSLIVVDTVRGARRIRMLESIRAFAADRMARPSAIPDLPEFTGPEALRDLRDRHAAHYAELGSPRESLKLCVAGGLALEATRAHDAANLRAAMEHALQWGPALHALWAATAVARPAIEQGPSRITVEMIDRVLAAVPEQEHTRSAVARRALRVVGAELLERAGRSEESVARLDALLAEMDDPAERFSPALLRATALIRMSRLEEAEAICLQALETDAEGPDVRPGLAFCHLALIQALREEFDGLPERFAEAARVAREEGAERRELVCLANEGVALKDQQRWAEAEAKLRPVAQRFRQGRSLGHEASCRSALAEVLRATGRNHEALHEAETALGLAQRAGHRRQWAEAAAGIGEALRSVGREDDARARFREAAEIGHEIGHELTSTWQLRLQPTPTVRR